MANEKYSKQIIEPKRELAFGKEIFSSFGDCQLSVPHSLWCQYVIQEEQKVRRC